MFYNLGTWFFFRHEVADIASLASFSFGLEEEDRYVMLWKKVSKHS